MTSPTQCRQTISSMYYQKNKRSPIRGFLFFYPLNDASDHLKIHNERLSYLILIGEKYLKGMLNIYVFLLKINGRLGKLISWTSDKQAV